MRTGGTYPGRTGQERERPCFIEQDSLPSLSIVRPSLPDFLEKPSEDVSEEASFPYLEMATCLLEFTNSSPVMVVRGTWSKVQPDNKAIPARCSSLNIGLDHGTGSGLTMESIGS